MDDGQAPATHATYRCGAIVIDAGLRQVLIDGQPARLGARAFDVLLALVERRERVVTKRELLDLVWPRLVVEENNLQVHVVALRKLLGPQAIATIPGRGYRFVGPIEIQDETLLPPSPQHPNAPASLVSHGNLPAPPPLIGREDDLAQVTALLRDHAVVSIVGAGGIGKTSLGLAVAAALDGDAYPQGRWWVELAAINSGVEIPALIAATLGVPLGDKRAPPAALAAALSSQAMLLVLDNVEHLADQVATLVDTLRRAAPAVRVLVTSQELLKCAGEQAYRLGSLSLPEPDAVLAPEDAVQHGAVALFVERAHALDARFRLGADNLAAVLDICRRLDEQRHGTMLDSVFGREHGVRLGQ